MADETTVKWLYPPNFYGTFDEPEIGKVKGPRRYSVLCTCYSDGTGEDDSVKVRRTDLKTTEGETPSKLVIEKIAYDISGMAVRISCNNMNDEEIAVLNSGQGEIDFTNVGGFVPIDDDTQDNDGGDIVFTTESATSGDTYSIKIDFRVKQ